MAKENPTGPLFRLRLVPGVRHLARVAAAGMMPPPRFWSSGTGIELTLAGRALVAPDEADIGAVPTAVALLRTLFENHHVDPEHQSCLFFNGCTIGTCTVQYDFSVTHRGGAVVLSHFTFNHFQDFGPIPIPLTQYAREVLQFARRARSIPEPLGLTGWAERLRADQRKQLLELIELAEGLVGAGCRNHAELCEEFRQTHGLRKRPLELLLLAVAEEGARPGDRNPEGPAPWVVECRVQFGPISVNELVPLRVNGGDVVLAQAVSFGPRGVTLHVMGVGSGGLAAGDRLTGVQQFYP